MPLANFGPLRGMYLAAATFLATHGTCSMIASSGACWNIAGKWMSRSCRSVRFLPAASRRERRGLVHAATQQLHVCIGEDTLRRHLHQPSGAGLLRSKLAGTRLLGGGWTVCILPSTSQTVGLWRLGRVSSDVICLLDALAWARAKRHVTTWPFTSGCSDRIFPRTARPGRVWLPLRRLHSVLIPGCRHGVLVTRF